MIIGEKLREIREAKGLSQGDIERVTGLLRCYTSRVEHGHTVPSVATLQKYAHALKVPIHEFFLAAGEKPVKRSGPEVNFTVEARIPRSEKIAFAKAISRLDSRERSILLVTAAKMARGTRKQ